jgi:murein DD-endopeptidase MepM/ murein hydrolase activator NlpD
MSVRARPSMLLGSPRRARAAAIAAALLAYAPAGRADEPTITVEDGHTGAVVEIPVSALDPSPASAPPDGGAPPPGEGAEAPLPTLDDPRLETPRPTRWRPAVMRCRRYRRRRYCEGPRRVPEPHGPAAELAARLGLGDRRAAAICLEHRPPEAWLEAVSLERHAALAFPVDDGRQGRGLARARGRRPGHDGVDLPAPAGATVRAAEDGLVVYADNELHGYGNLVILAHADGSVSFYAHLRAAYVFAGEVVRMGQVLGEVGETGLARGPHLHFELRRDGRPVDPTDRFVRLERSAGAASETPARASVL